MTRSSWDYNYRSLVAHNPAAVERKMGFMIFFYLFIFLTVLSKKSDFDLKLINCTALCTANKTNGKMLCLYFGTLSGTGGLKKKGSIINLL